MDKVLSKIKLCYTKNMKIKRRKKENGYDDKAVLEMVLFCFFYYDRKIPIDKINRLFPQSDKTWYRYVKELASLNLLPPNIQLLYFEGERCYTTKEDRDELLGEVNESSIIWYGDYSAVLDMTQADKHSNRLGRLAYMVTSYCEFYNCLLLFKEDVENGVYADELEEQELTISDCITAYEDYCSAFDLSEKSFRRDLTVVMHAMAVYDSKWQEKLIAYQNKTLKIVKFIDD